MEVELENEAAAMDAAQRRRLASLKEATRHREASRTAEDVRVVVVDDEADFRDTIKTLLELDGYNVRTAADAEEALRVIDAHQPVCVILDLGLPGIDGIELTAQLRSRHDAGTVVIVVTGSTEPEDHAAVEIAGADFILTKPLDVASLTRMLPRIA
jgi:DNA-binding response OmpR family regulator